MHTFNELILKHKGKVFCVMGGAPSLGEDLANVKADVYISANEHGATFRKPDYVVALDDHHGKTGERIVDYLRKYTQAPIIGQNYAADYVLETWPDAPRKIYSGMAAIWCAWAMGAKVVILAGMNAYDGKPQAMKDARLVADKVRCPVRVAVRLATIQTMNSKEQKFVPDAENKLCDVWPVYMPGEKFGRYTPHPSIEGLRGTDNRIKVVVLKPTEFNGVPVRPETQLTGMRHEFKRLLKHNMVREV